jgi:predicted aldo/keto reductase-like oxidoreductase
MGFVQGEQQYMTSTAMTSRETHNAGRCVKCRACEKHCPQGLPVSALMADVRRKLEPWWFALAFKAARAFLRAGRPVAPAGR